MEEWRNGVVGYWKNGKMEKWNGRILERWKCGVKILI